jgi:hypothetical protein
MACDGRCDLQVSLVGKSVQPRAWTSCVRIPFDVGVVFSVLCCCIGSIAAFEESSSSSSESKVHGQILTEVFGKAELGLRRQASKYQDIAPSRSSS